MARNGSNGIRPGRAYRAYRFPHHSGRLSRRPGSVGRSLGGLAGAAGLVIAVFALFTATAAASAWSFFSSDLPAAHDLESAPMPLSTFIYDRTGEHLLYRLEDQRRELITLDQVPLKLQEATTAIEDKSFWTNPGVDVGGIIRAWTANQASGAITQGGSTITQQLIKTRLLGDEPTYTRKIKEAILALEATRLYPKQKILEMYFNQIYYGNQAYGIKAAAGTYFGVGSLDQLTLGQMALLAGLPQLPSAYDPVQNPAAAKARRTAVLDAMLESGYITKAERDQADAEKVEVKPAATPILAPHFTFRVREQLAQIFGEKAAYEGGYRVYTTLDWNMQLLAEKEVRDHVDSLKGANVNNAALITMDPTTGEILAYVGSYDYYNNSPKVRGDYDSAGIAMRQPGSTFKLFTYMTGMLKGFLGKPLTASTILNDIEFCMADGSATQYCPKNAPSTSGFSVQNGPISFRQALRESVNNPALSVARAVGVDAIMDTVAQFGIRRDWGDRSNYGISFGIGAGELRLIDMTSAFQVIANMGVRVEPTFIHKIIDRNGKVVRDFAAEPESRRVIDAAHAYVMADILKDNTDPAQNWIFGNWTTIGRPAGLKTGTTDNLQDVWAIGFTPQRLTGIWMGNADNSEMRGITSAMGPGVLWRDYMKTVVGGLPPVWYEKPANVVNVTVCINPTIMGGNGSGLLPSPACPASFRRNEIFVKGTEPTTDDRTMWIGGCYRLIAHFPEWQPFANRWAANAGTYSGGRFGGVCGTGGPMASGSPGASPSVRPSPSGPTPQVTPTVPPPGKTIAPPTPAPTTPPPVQPTPTPPPPTKKP